jgi:PBSX family phage terminase large subunit
MMQLAIAPSTELVIPPPELRGAALELGRCRDLECCLDGPAGSGKTLSALYKIHMMLTMYPGAKALITRKSNTALAGSAMATFREMLDPREGVYYFGGNKVKPAAWMYPNGSEMNVNGLDKPEKVKSWEWDIALCNEATECEEEDIEFVRSRLRHGKLPYHQLIMDVNPSYPTHWLNVRMNEGRTTRLLSRHEDNPRYFNLKTNDWTEEGRNYIFGVLGGLTGVRLARLRYGIWAAAEGTVYEDSWDRARNVIKRHDIPADWPRYLSLDFGYVHPFVCKWYAEDPDGRYICYREIYMTKRLVEEHAKQVKALSRWGQTGGDPLPRVIYADHDAEGRATFERHTGLFTTPAHKAVTEGIQAMAARLRPAGDGRPRLLYFEDCLVGRDPELIAAKKPVCTFDEFDMYVWDTRGGQKKGEVPVKEYDHGLDTDRYLCAKDLTPRGVSYFSNIWK